jgi:hypothetical protein
MEAKGPKQGGTYLILSNKKLSLSLQNVLLQFALMNTPQVEKYNGKVLSEQLQCMWNCTVSVRTFLKKLNCKPVLHCQAS